MTPVARVALLFAFALCELAAEAGKSGYAGAAVCARCHPAQYLAQSVSAHAHSISRASEHPLALLFVPGIPLFRPPRYRFDFHTGGNGPEVRVSDGRNTIELPIEWAFGAGEQAVTFVGRKDGGWYIEHYFSYYTDVRALGPTPGHEALRSNTLASAAGYLYRSDDAAFGIIACFRCHSTGPPAAAAGNRITPLETGVRCEACHGPGAGHAAGVRRAVRNLKGMPGPELNQLCGECHRAPEGGPAVNWNKAWSVRYQPAYLARSACFQGSGGALSCVTCHDPHGPLEKDVTAYDRRCSACHPAPRHSPALGATASPVSGCTGCHMPRVTAQPHLRFTNHWIGVYSEEDALKPRTRR